MVIGRCVTLFPEIDTSTRSANYEIRRNKRREEEGRRGKRKVGEGKEKRG